MESDTYLHVRELPELREPILLAAFAGWNDAAQAATSALLTLCRAWQVERFADIEPENFFVFTETRPTVSLDATQQRSLNWPANREACLQPLGKRPPLRVRVSQSAGQSRLASGCVFPRRHSAAHRRA